MIFVRSVLEKVDEKILLITIVGGLEAIKNKGITINEMEKFIFSPYMVKRLKEVGCHPPIIELIEKGCELEDIDSLIPEELNAVTEELKREALYILKQYETYDYEFWIN